MMHPTRWRLFGLSFLWLNLRCTIAAVEPVHESAEDGLLAHNLRKIQNGNLHIKSSQGIRHATPPSMRHLATSSFAVAQQFESIRQKSGYNTIISGAASRTTLVSITSDAIQIQSKKGVTLYSGSLYAILKITSRISKDTVLLGKVDYDGYADRFVIAAVLATEAPKSVVIVNSTMYVAVSKTGTPGGVNDWYVQSINNYKYDATKKEFTTAITEEIGFGVTPQSLFVNTNIVGAKSGKLSGQLLYIIAKSSFYSGGKLSYSTHNPLVALPSSVNAVLRSKVSGLIDLKPARILGGAVGGNIGTFMLGYFHYESELGLSVGNTSYLYIATVKNALSSPTFSSTVLNIGEINKPSATRPLAPQLGSDNSIYPGGGSTWLFDGVWRNNSLWVTLQVVPLRGPNVNQFATHWIQIKTDTATNKFTVVDKGEIGAKDLGKGTFTFNPAIAVNRKGVAAIGFSASGPLIHPGAYVVGRAPTDPKGNVSKTFIVKAGVDVYSDYYYNIHSSVAVDPVDDSFWVYNSYAAKRNTTVPIYESALWGTAWRRFFKNG